MVHIDLDSPRVSRTEGEPIFREQGGNSEFLEHITGVLGMLHEGIEATPAFILALLEHDLLESFVLDIQFLDGAQHRFAGFYTIQEERLSSTPRRWASCTNAATCCPSTWSSRRSRTSAP